MNECLCRPICSIVLILLLLRSNNLVNVSANGEEIHTISVIKYA